MKAKTFLLIAALALVAGLFAWWDARRPETTPALRGERLARTLGCFGCHGPGGEGGVADPSAPGGEIPSWRHETAKLYVASRSEIREWILHGTTARERERPARPRLVPMPAYADRLSPRELEDLVAYFVAVSGWREEYTEEEWRGRELAARMGCFGCHGPSGMGGVPNPGSFKGHIPPWHGAEYTELVHDEAELREWILTGRSRRLWNRPAARFFLEGQKIPMPPYHDHLSDPELDSLVAYIRSLHRETERVHGGVEAAPPAASANAAPPFLTELAGTLATEPPPGEPLYRSPIHLCRSPDATRVYVVNRTADTVSVLDPAARGVRAEIPVGRYPSYAVVSPDGGTLYVSCTYEGVVDVVDLAEGHVVARWPVGHEPLGMTLSADGSRLAVVNSLAGTVSILDTETGATRATVPVGRAPRYVAETPDGTRLVVPNARSRDVSILDARTGRVLETRALDRGAQMRNVACTADGRWAILATLVGHDEMITVQMERGWINSNGFTVLDLHRQGHYVTLLLDRLLSGATNPWAVVLSADEKRLFVSLAGLHQVAIVDLPGVLALVAATRPEEVQRRSQEVGLLEREGLARRVDAGGLGPRSLVELPNSGELLVANYFDDTVSVLDAVTGEFIDVIPLGPRKPRSLWREGELRFNDGRICFENWFSCASCHQEDGTVDSLNWDLINDGMGNPKNAKSMHDGIFSPPAMWSGVRADQNAGTMAGQRFLGFLPDDDVQAALMEFIGKPRRAPNPFRDTDPQVLARGRSVFFDARCDVCHVPPRFTDGAMHDVGLRGYTSEVDFRARFDTPSLHECYRTAPYLHDGRAATLREIFVDHNDRNAHGLTRGLTDQQLDDLVAYLRSL